jgi:hypothetical protein
MNIIINEHGKVSVSLPLTDFHQNHFWVALFSPLLLCIIFAPWTSGMAVSILWTIALWVLVAALLATTLFFTHLWLKIQKIEFNHPTIDRSHDALILEKEEQHRYFSNVIHEVIKGEAQCILAETTTSNPLQEKLSEFVKICELSQVFIEKSNNNLFELMHSMEFIFAQKIHSEIDERYLYCDIDASLKDIILNYKQKYEIIFFLRECLNNIQKHAQYRHVGLVVRKEKPSEKEGTRIAIEINDDGKGLPHTLQTEDTDIVITERNIAQYQQQFFQKKRSTGIVELFRKAQKLNGVLAIRSSKDLGTKVSLTFPLEP